VGSYCWNRVALARVTRLRRDILQAAARARTRAEPRPPGDFVQALDETAALRIGWGNVGFHVASGMLPAAVMIVYLCVAYPPVGVGVALIAAAVVYLGDKGFKALDEIGQQRAAATRTLFLGADDARRMARVIRAMDLGRWAEARMASASTAIQQSGERGARTLGAGHAMVIGTLPVFFGVGLGGLSLTGELTAKSAVIILGVVGTLAPAVINTAYVASSRARARAAASVISALLDRGVWGGSPACPGGPPIVADAPAPEARSATPAPAADLELREVSLVRGATAIVSGVSTTIAPGEKVAIIGARGSGKTSLLRLLSGEAEPTRGTLHLPRGAVVRWFSEDARLLPLELGAQLPLQDAALAEVLGELTTLPADEVFRAERFSGGQVRRLALARLLHAGGDLLLLDEPTAGLDAEREGRALRALLAYPATVVLFTTRPTIADRFPRVLVLDGGRLIDDGPPPLVAPRCAVYRALAMLAMDEEPAPGAASL
jgi:ATP-binding cassette subfamily B protein